MEKKIVKALIEKHEGKLLAIASDESADRDGDQIMLDGWELKNFKANPVLMWLHMMDGDLLPIGRAKNIGIKEINGKKRLTFEPEFHELTEFAKTVKAMYDEGYLKAFSVGFQPKEWEKIDESKFPPSYRYTKQELVEISAVPIPALPTALIMNALKDNKAIKQKELKAVMKDLEYAEKNPQLTTANGDGEENEEKSEKVDKKGRVLSSKNEGKIKQAQALLSEVLSALGEEKPADDEEDADKKAIAELKEKVDKLIVQNRHILGEIQKHRVESKSDIGKQALKKALDIVADATTKAVSKVKNSSEESSQ